MFYIGDLFQWERFITPSIIKIFYWLAVIITVLIGLSGLVSALGMMTFSPLAGIITAIVSLAGMFVGIIFIKKSITVSAFAPSTYPEIAFASKLAGSI